MLSNQQTNKQTSFLCSSSLLAIRAVMHMSVLIPKAPHASQHLCPAKLQTTCDIKSFHWFTPSNFSLTTIILNMPVLLVLLPPSPSPIIIFFSYPSPLYLIIRESLLFSLRLSKCQNHGQYLSLDACWQVDHCKYLTKYVTNSIITPYSSPIIPSTPLSSDSSLSRKCLFSSLVLSAVEFSLWPVILQSGQSHGQEFSHSCCLSYGPLSTFDYVNYQYHIFPRFYSPSPPSPFSLSIPSHTQTISIVKC